MIAYRPDVDGLRAISILTVVAFHAGVPFMPGGFVGVDVFFVISGYLIGAIILSDVAVGRFSTLRFYERRIRRILPALLTMLLAVGLAAAVFMLPSEFRHFPPTLTATLLFGSNILFWRRSGYFAPGSETEPLLHGWSIGIEEQFYLAAPVILLVLHRLLPRRIAPLLIGFTLVSFGLCVAATWYRPVAAFYLLPFRAWELSTGMVLAALPASKGGGRIPAALAALGLGTILVSALLFESGMRFPGYAAALPVAGAALVIRFATGTSVGRFLTWPPLVFIGLISYSLYLWHWPLLVFGRLLGYVEGSPLGAAVAVALSFGLATLSWRFVEQPFRQRGRVGNRALLMSVGGVSAVLLAFGTAAERLDGWPQRWSARAVAMDRGRDNSSPYRYCHRDTGVEPIERACTLGAGTASTAIWGDSHGIEIGTALAEAGSPLLTITYSSCPPALGLDPSERPQCRAHNQLVLSYLEREPRIRTVLLAMHWEHWGRQPGFWPGIAATIRRLREAGKRVILIGPVPSPGGDVPSRLARGGTAGFARADFDRRLAPDIANLRRLEAIAPIFWPDHHLCAGGRCRLIVDGAPAYFDDNHLSMPAARFLARRFPPLDVSQSR